MYFFFIIYKLWCTMPNKDHWFNLVIARFADRFVRSHCYNKHVPKKENLIKSKELEIHIKHRLNDLMMLFLANREIDMGTSRILNITFSLIIVSLLIKVHSLWQWIFIINVQRCSYLVVYSYIVSWCEFLQWYNFPIVS